MSRTAMVGSPPLSWIQCFPPSMVKNAAELRAGEKQIRIHVSSANAQHRPVLGQVARDRSPGFPAIGALQQIGFEVVILVIVESGVHGVRVVHAKPRAGSRKSSRARRESFRTCASFRRHLR